MSSNHNREYENQKLEEFENADEEGKLEIIAELRYYEFNNLADELEAEIACDFCGKADCVCDREYMEAVNK